MMKDPFDKFFEENKEAFDHAEPNIGHFERFKARLEDDKGEQKRTRGRNNWYLLAVAASILLFFGYWMGSQQNQVDPGLQLADLSPQMEETQNFYVATIEKEINLIKDKRTDINKKIIDDAFAQLTILEANYQKLTLELKESNGDKRVVYAMISNFQQRLEVLQNLMDQLEEFEQMIPQENSI